MPANLKITKKRAIKKRTADTTELANKPTMLLVLGMHRSGTSVTARLMECLGGVNSSNQMPTATDNPVGFFEDYDIYQLNENTVLPRLGIKWHSVGFVDWSRLSSQDRSKLALQALEIVRKNYNPANSLSILKEPRIGILLPFWLSVLRHAGYNVKVVCAVRDPISVARSLQKRDGLSTTHGGMLYVTNWLSILNYIQELPVAFVSFEEVFQDPAAVLRKVSEKLQIRPPQDFEVRVHQFASDFIDPALCHHRIESQDLALETDLPPLAIEAYEHLLAAAQFQNIKKTGRFVPNSEKRIASIKPVLEDFDRLLQRLHQENSRNADLQKSYEVTKSIADQSTASIQASQEQARQLIQKEALQRGEMAERLTRLNTEKASLEAALAEAHAQRLSLSTELEHEKTRAADAANLSAKTNAECASLQEQVATAQTQATQFQQRIHELEAANNQLASERGEMAANHSALNTVIRKRDEECANLKNNVEQRFRELADLSKMYLASEERGEVAVTDNIKLKKTISWKTTAPLRFPNQLLKKLSKQERVLRNQRKIILKSGLFDKDFYLKKYPDVAARKIDPIYHYLSYGAEEGRNPSGSFDTIDYLNFYPDVRNDKMSINPFLHFIIYGLKEGRKTIFQSHIDPISKYCEKEESESSLNAELANQSFGHFPHTPMVSVIIVSYNSGKDLEDLLPSIKAQSYHNIEIIVVENGTENNEPLVRSHFENASYLYGHGNIGFAAANNLAFDKSVGELLALINPDTKVDTDWLRDLVEALKIDAGAAVAVPKIRFFERYVDITITSNGEFNVDPTALANQLNYAKWFVIAGAQHAQNFVAGSRDNNVTIRLPVDGSHVRLPIHCQYAQEVRLQKENTRSPLFALSAPGIGDYEISIDLTNDANPQGQWLINNAGSGVRSEGPYDIGFCNYDEGHYDSKAYVQALCGCSALLRRVAIIGRNIFAPEFYAYYEDSELSSWIQNQNYKILYIPTSIVYHKHSTSSSEGSPLWNTLVSRGRDLYQAATQPDQFEIIQSIQNREYSSAVPKSMADTLREYDRDYVKNIKNIASRKRPSVGIYNSYWNTMGGGELHALSFAIQLQEKCDVYLICEEDFDIDRLASYFNLNLSKCRKIVSPHFSSAWTGKYDVFINSTFLSNIFSTAKMSLYIVSFPQEKLDEKTRNNYIFLHNSNYTKKWADKYWGDHKSHVILPILSITIPDFSLSHKEKLILSVGRFTPSGHCKNHHLIIQSFLKATAESKKMDGWRLVLCGSYNESKEEEREYFNALQFLAIGGPVELIPNVEHDTLRSLYEKASVYVHATGMGRDEISEPQLHEHFGISCFEAMSYGCHPIVYDVGGPAEQIKSMGIGSSFRNNKELANKINKYVARRGQEKSNYYALSVQSISIKILINNNNNSMAIINNLILAINKNY